MIDITLENNMIFYENYKSGLEFLSNINYDNYEYPKERVKFHVYTEANTEKELESIKSYLATQNLDKTELIVWSDYDITNQENIQPYKDLVTLKVYSATEEAKGTPLEGKTKYLTPEDTSRHWMNSGIFRFLVLYKYGGIYYDMDMVLLRDFKPLLNQNFAYQWGSSTNFSKISGQGEMMGPCAALLGAIKGDEYIRNCMEQLIVTEIRPATTCFDEDMLSYVYKKNPNAFTVFPSTFFNTEWLISRSDPETKELKKLIEQSWFINNGYAKDNLFLEAFAWHWHNSSNNHKTIEPGSKFYELQQITNNKLRNRGISYD
jgi:hypothetical protein